MTDGAAALEKWIAKRARRADRIVALEESLLAGGFVRYALRRLAAFGLARGFAIIVHLVELTWLAQIFSAKAFVASLALQNVTLVVESFFWGALESYRRQARALGPSSGAAALATRWMSLALRIGAVVTLAPIAMVSYAWWAEGKAPGILEAYAVLCGLRLGVELVLRAYYSGVFAHRRVHRTIWSTLVTPVFLVGVTFVLWDSLKGWSFVIGLAAATAASRALFFVFTRRGYERHRVPKPSFVRMFRGPRLDRAMLDGAFLGGVANLASRVASIVLLAIVVPSLASAADFGGEIEPLAFALHLASPFLLVASQWTFVFYHDEKRLEERVSWVLARRLQRHLFFTAVLIGLLAWGCVGVILRAYLPWDEALPTLEPLLPTLIGLGLLAVVQMRSFARGQFVVMAASSFATLAVAGLVAFTRDPEVGPSLVTLAVAPWVGLVAHVAFERWKRTPSHAPGAAIPTLVAWTELLLATRAEVVVWTATVAEKPSLVVDRIAQSLGSTGAAHRHGRTLLWFEPPQKERRRHWIGVASGHLRRLSATSPGRGAALAKELQERGELCGPSHDDLDALIAEHDRAFPEGFVLRIGGTPPARFRALGPDVRQAIWRDGVRAHAAVQRVKQTSGWRVVAYAPEGALEALFVRPRGAEPSKIKAWRELAVQHRWSVGRDPASPVRGTPGTPAERRSEGVKTA